METGSVLYGVTMQEPGVSKLVSVRWEGDEAPSRKHSAANCFRGLMVNPKFRVAIVSLKTISVCPHCSFYHRYFFFFSLLK